MDDDLQVNLSKMKPVDSIKGESDAETGLLRAMSTDAHRFLCAQEWCEHVDQQYLAYGIGGVVAIFLFQIAPRFEDVDRTLWVIVGDLPPAYIVASDNLTAAGALDAYCVEMEAWVQAVLNDGSVEELIPVNAPPTRDYATQLGGRIEFLRSRILPLVQAYERAP